MSDHIHKCPRTSHLLQSRFEPIGSSNECTTTGIWHIQYNADNKRAQRARLRSSPTAILKLVRGSTSARARSGIPRHSGNCYRPILFSNDTTVVEMAYDYMGRRFEYKEMVNNTLTRHERYLYRGHLQIAALDMLTSGIVKHVITWDPTEPIATRPLSLQIGANAYFYSLDQVKNVSELFDSVGNLAATYDYSPFGALISFQMTQSGNNALTQFSNPLSFSSEIHDSTLGLQYYNYRHLNMLDGRWVNRDPIEENGGLNVYGFCGNEVLVQSDFLGRMASINWKNDDAIRWSAFAQIGRTIIDFFNGGPPVFYEFEYPDLVAKRFLKHSQVHPIWKEFKETSLADYGYEKKYTIQHVASKLDFVIDVTTLFGILDPRNWGYLDVGVRATGSFSGEASISIKRKGNRCVKELDMTLSDQLSIESFFRNPLTRRPTITNDYLSRVSIKVNYLVEEEMGTFRE